MQRITIKKKDSNDEICCLCSGHYIESNGELRVKLIDGRIFTFPPNSFDPYALLVIEVDMPPVYNITNLYKAESLSDISLDKLITPTYKIPNYNWQDHHCMTIIYASIKDGNSTLGDRIATSAQMKVFDSIFYYVEKPSITNQTFSPGTLYNLMGVWLMADSRGISRLTKIPVSTR